MEWYKPLKNIKKVSTWSMNLAQIQPKQSRTQSCNLKEKEQKQSETYCVKILLGLLPKAVAKWNNTFLDLGWPAIYSSLKHSTSDTRLKWFQYRILHRVLTTNDYLYKRKVIDSDRCTFCKTEKETKSQSPPLGLHLHRDLLEARFRMDHKAYTSCTFSQYHGAIGYFWRKRWRNNGVGQKAVGRTGRSCMGV